MFTQDEKEIGRVKEVVVDPRTKSVTHLVIQEGLLFSSDTLVPVQAVEEAFEDVVRLNVDSTELTNLTATYRVEHFVEAESEPRETKGLTGLYWLRPPGTQPSLIPPGLGRVELPPDVAISGNDVLIIHGSPVQTIDGKLIGKIEEVITDEQEQITHIRIQEGGTVYAEPKLVPADWILRVEDNQIVLSVDKRTVDQVEEV